MSTATTSKVGKILWQDLTVPNAEEVQRFYSEVVGWNTTPHDMGEYHDYNVQAPASNETIAGICHARGTNAAIPPQWLLYVAVEDVEASALKCKELGGELIDGPRMMGAEKFCVLRDPAGAVIAIIGG